MYFFIFINLDNNDFVIDNFLLEVKIFIIYFVDNFFLLKLMIYFDDNIKVFFLLELVMCYLDIDVR